MIHIPVLQKEVLKYLDPKPNENFIDCTIGQAGHSLAILEKTAPKGKILGIEWDPELYQKLKERCSTCHVEQRVILVNDSYSNLKEIVERENFKPVSGILFDLGMSSWHLEESGRGFSFLKKEPLDMRYNLGNPLTAEKIVNYWSKQEIEKILREYGQEQFAKRISEKIVETRLQPTHHPPTSGPLIRPIKNTSQLVEIIEKAVPHWYEHQRLHFATRTFQALRIAVNDELNNLEIVLPQAREILKSGGRLVIISFHSLEDRIVKNFFREHPKNNLLKILTKKPITPTNEEIKINPRSRSAKLRAAIKI